MMVEAHLLFAYLFGALTFEFIILIGIIAHCLGYTINSESLTGWSFLLAFITGFMGFCTFDKIYRKLPLRKWLDRAEHNSFIRFLFALASGWLIHIVFMTLCIFLDAVLELNQACMICLQLSWFFVGISVLGVFLFFKKIRNWMTNLKYLWLS